MNTDDLLVKADTELPKVGTTEYVIPEGYEAEIKDGKVILTKKESEDSKLKKSLLEFLDDVSNNRTRIVSGEQFKRWHDWLNSLKDVDAEIETNREFVIDSACEWLKKHIANYVNWEYNDYHHAFEYDGSVNVEKLISDFKSDMQSKITRKDIINLLRAEYEKGIADAIASNKPVWKPSQDEMGVLYKLCYLSSNITDEDDTNLTRLYQDLKREFFNGHSFENMEFQIMKPEDIEALKKWLVEHGYYVGDSSVAESLRKIADSWDD